MNIEQQTLLPLGRYQLERPLVQVGKEPVTHCYVIFTDEGRAFNLAPVTNAMDISTAVGYKDGDYHSADVIQWCWENKPTSEDVKVDLFDQSIYIGMRVLREEGLTAYPPTQQMFDAISDMNRLYNDNPGIFERPARGHVLTVVANSVVQGGSATPALFVLLTNGDPNVVVTGTTGLLPIQDRMNLRLPRYPLIPLEEEAGILRRKAIIVNDPSTPYYKLLAVAPEEIQVPGVTCVSSYAEIYAATRKRGVS
jgi:hypothetical protein